MLDGIRESRRGRVVVGQQNVDARGGKYLSDCGGKGARGEARVISNSEAFLRIFAFDYVVGDSTGGAPNILKGEIIGNNAAPSVGAKFDWFNPQPSNKCRIFKEHGSKIGFQPAYGRKNVLCSKSLLSQLEPYPLKTISGAKARIFKQLSFARLESLAPPLKSGGFHG